MRARQLEPQLELPMGRDPREGHAAAPRGRRLQPQLKLPTGRDSREELAELGRQRRAGGGQGGRRERAHKRSARLSPKSTGRRTVSHGPPLCRIEARGNKKKRKGQAAGERTVETRTAGRRTATDGPSTRESQNAGPRTTNHLPLLQ